MNELTPRQREVYLYLESYIKKNGYAPTLRETMNGLGLSSTNTVRQHLDRLAKKGVIERNENISRGIKICGQGKARTIPVLERSQLFLFSRGSCREIKKYITVGDEIPDTAFGYQVTSDLDLPEGILVNDHLIIDSSGKLELEQMALVQIPGRLSCVRPLTAMDKYISQQYLPNVFIGQLLQLYRNI